MLKWQIDSVRAYDIWHAGNSRCRGLLAGITPDGLKTAVVLTQQVWSVQQKDLPNVEFDTWFYDVLRYKKVCPREFERQLRSVRPFQKHLLEFFLVECSFHVMEALLRLCGKLNVLVGCSTETSYFFPLMQLYIAKSSDARVCRPRHVRFETLTRKKLDQDGNPETYVYTNLEMEITAGSFFPLPKPSAEDWQTQPVQWDLICDDQRDASQLRLQRDSNFMKLVSSVIEFKSFGFEVDHGDQRADWLALRRFLFAWIQTDFVGQVCAEFKLELREVQQPADLYDARALAQSLGRLVELEEAWVTQQRGSCQGHAAPAGHSRPEVRGLALRLPSAS